MISEYHLCQSLGGRVQAALSRNWDKMTSGVCTTVMVFVA